MRFGGKVAVMRPTGRLLQAKHTPFAFAQQSVDFPQSFDIFALFDCFVRQNHMSILVVVIAIRMRIFYARALEPNRFSRCHFLLFERVSLLLVLYIKMTEKLNYRLHFRRLRSLGLGEADGFVVSPVYGVVSDIGDDSITIYIARNDDHRVFAPTSGTVTQIESFQGSWTRNIFQASVHKTARTTITIQNQHYDLPVSFWLEVGKPKYITDRIRIDKGKTVGEMLTQGEQMGEILLGSLAEVHFNGLRHKTLVQRGTKLLGGKSAIAKLFLEERENA